MILSLKGQTIFFFQMVLTGAMIGVGYDVLRLCRTYFPLRGLLLQVEDFLFWLTALFFAFSKTQKRAHCAPLFSCPRRSRGLIFFSAASKKGAVRPNFQ